MGARVAGSRLYRDARAAVLSAGRRVPRMTHIARKRFGQHFLADEAVVDAIVDAIDPRQGERLVEIGPGLGALTDPLVAAGG
jgi:hypothetical protein